MEHAPNIVNTPKEWDKQHLTDEIQDQDAQGERLLFMVTATTAGISSEELEDFVEA